MTGGVSAQAYLEAVVHIDGETGLVIGKPQISDMNQNSSPAPCGVFRK